MLNRTELKQAAQAMASAAKFQTGDTYYVDLEAVFKILGTFTEGQPEIKKTAEGSWRVPDEESK